jgi:moderate conductance mechanosensitive channel
MAGPHATLPAQTELTDACGEEPSWICQRVFDATSNQGLAEFSDLVFGTVGRILLILLVAGIAHVVVRRAIGRFVRRLVGNSNDTLTTLRRRTDRFRKARQPDGGEVESTLAAVRAVARTETLTQVLRSTATALIWSIAAVTILGELGVNLGPLLASAGIAGVALGFGAQSLVRDFLSGFFMLVEDQYGVGDIVDVGEVTGEVEAVTLRVTRVRDLNGTVWHVPNGTIERVGNMSQDWARAVLDVGVAYGTDLDLAQQVVQAAAEELWRDPEWENKFVEEPEVWGIDRFDADAIVVRLVIKTKPAEQWGVARALRRRLWTALQENGIEIPFQQRTVWLRHADPDDPSRGDN